MASRHGSREDASSGATRRAVTVALALALAGCAGTDQRQRTDADSLDASRKQGGDLALADPGDQPGRTWENAEPSEWWRTLPDLAVVNENVTGVTAWLTIYGPDWIEPWFREVVSLRAPLRGEPPARVTVDDVGVVGARGVLAVETADGVRGHRDWHGGGPREGVCVHLRADEVAFRSLTL